MVCVGRGGALGHFGELELTGLQDERDAAFFTLPGNLLEVMIPVSKSNGTGLGLSVTHSLVEAHDGEINFETSPNQGTSFNVYLPTLLKKKAAKILVVDDDDAIRQILIPVLLL